MLDAPRDTLLVNRQKLPFTLDRGIAHRAAIGLVVLATDQTIEHEWRQMLCLDGVAFYESRIYNSPTITPETLAEMASGIAAAAALIKPGIPLDALAYGCTSGATDPVFPKNSRCIMAAPEGTRIDRRNRGRRYRSFGRHRTWS